MVEKLFRVCHTRLVFIPDALQLILEILVFAGDFGGLFLQTDDLQFQVLKGYQVPKIWIHLFAPSKAAILEEDPTHIRSGLAYLQFRLSLFFSFINLYRDSTIHFAAAVCQSDEIRSQGSPRLRRSRIE